MRTLKRWTFLRGIGCAGLLSLASMGALALDLQGHRGARGLAPENSIAGFERAIRLGVSRLETDAAVTRDGVIVLHHDLTLNPNHTRDAQGRWLDQPSKPLHHMDWADIATYDIGQIKPGSRYASQFPDQKPVDGTRVPRLSALFELIQRPGHQHVHLAIETKLDPRRPQDTLEPLPFATQLVDAIRKAGLQQRVQIMSFDWRTLQVVQRIAPEIPTVYLTAQQKFLDNIAAADPAGSIWTAGFQFRQHGSSVPRMIKAAGGTIWSVFHGDLDEAQLKEAQALGLKVLVWTVNDTAGMSRWLDLKVDGLITDRPDLAHPLVLERGLVIQP